MKLFILSCLIAATFAMPTDLSGEPEPQERGLKEDIEHAASNIAHNYNDIKNEVQNQLSNLPHQISDNIIAPIQQAVGPIKESDDAYHITVVLPKPQLPSWFSSLGDYIPNFLRPHGKSGFAGDVELESYLENSAEEPGAYLIILAIPNPQSWLQYAGFDKPHQAVDEAQI